MKHRRTEKLMELHCTVCGRLHPCRRMTSLYCGDACKSKARRMREKRAKQAKAEAKERSQNARIAAGLDAFDVMPAHQSSKSKKKHNETGAARVIICAGCGKPFWRDANRKPCTYCPETANACRQKAWRRARKAGCGRSESYSGPPVDKRTKAYRAYVHELFQRSA